MNHGKVAQVGTPREIYTHPADRFVASFLGEASFVAATVAEREPEGLRVESALGAMTVRDPGKLEAGARVTLVIRPEGVRLGAGPLSARIRSSTYLGSESTYQVAVKEVLLAAKVSNPLAEPPLPEDSEVPLQIDPRTIHVLAGDG
jgi:iron(III) transport system ATP-binding protein